MTAEASAEVSSQGGTILETVSENNTVRKRGRPRKFTADELSLAPFVVEKVVTARTLNNAVYRQRALSIILEHVEEYPALRCLFDPERVERGEQRLPLTLLSMLGRLRFPEVILNTALEVCRTKPKNLKDARTMLRLLVDDPKPLAVNELSLKIVSGINDYLRSCNEAPTPRLIRQALRCALDGGLNDAFQWDLK